MEFTITEADRTISPLFDFEPDFCAGSGSISIDNVPAGVTIDTDPQTQVLTIPQIRDSLNTANPTGAPGITETSYPSIPITYTYTTTGNV